MPIYVYQGNKQISTNAIRNNKAVKAIYAKEQGQEAVCVWGDDLVDSLFTYTIQNNSVTITGLKQNNQFSGNLLVPSKIKGKPVTIIGNSAFNGCADLTSVTIPNSVTDIGESVFSGCSSLESITIPFVGAKAGVKSSDTYKYPFGYIFGTSSYTGGVATTQYYHGSSTSSTTSTTYYIPSSLRSVTVTGGNILYGAFWNCTSLTSITIPNSVTSIGDSAFRNCSGLTSVTIPDGVTNIDDCAFDGCTSLTSVIIPDGVTSIGHYAFYDCTGLTSVTIPDSVTGIGNEAFSRCDKLQNIYITDIVTWCHSSTLYNLMKYTSSNKNLYLNNELVTTLIIPNGVMSIFPYVFARCSGLTSVTIPNSVTTIGEYAFYKCSSLTSIVIPNSVKDIGEYAFDNTLWYNNQPNGLVYAGKVAYKYKGTMPSNTSIVLKEGTLGIAGYAFYDCRGLTSMTIPDSVTEIGSYAFSGCRELTSITIGNGMKYIGDHAFEYCRSLASITFNGTIKQWNAIYKSGYWDSDTGNYTIHCTDGNIPKS